MFTLGRLCLVIAAEEQVWGNSGMMWLWGWELIPGQKWGSPLLVKTTKCLFMGLDVLLGAVQGGVAWRNRGYKYRGSVELLLAWEWGIFKWCGETLFQMGAMLNLAGMLEIGWAGGTWEVGSCKIHTLQNSHSSFPGCSLVSVCCGCCEQVDVWGWPGTSTIQDLKSISLLGFLSNLPKAGNTKSIPLAGDAKELNNL